MESGGNDAQKSLIEMQNRYEEEMQNKEENKLK